MNKPTITVFQRAEVGHTVLVQISHNKRRKGLVANKLPGAIVVDIDDQLHVINADKVISILK